MKNPVPFSPESVGEGINTSDDEYWPSITADGQTLMFTRQARPRENDKWKESSGGFLHKLSFRIWYGKTALNAGAPLNSSQNEGAQSLSSDGSYMYFTACDRSAGLGSCDIFFSAIQTRKMVNASKPRKSCKFIFMGVSAFNKCQMAKCCFFPVTGQEELVVRISGIQCTNQIKSGQYQKSW